MAEFSVEGYFFLVSSGILFPSVYWLWRYPYLKITNDEIIINRGILCRFKNIQWNSVETMRVIRSYWILGGVRIDLLLRNGKKVKIYLTLLSKKDKVCLTQQVEKVI